MTARLHCPLATIEAIHGGGNRRLRCLERGSGQTVVALGYTWRRAPGTDLEFRVLANRPVAAAILKPDCFRSSLWGYSVFVVELRGLGKWVLATRSRAR
jgi:hypothetical protein